MDLWKACSAHAFGPGGLKCPCCNDFRTKGKDFRKVKHLLSKKRRSILKGKLLKERYDDEQD